MRSKPKIHLFNYKLQHFFFGIEYKLQHWICMMSEKPYWTCIPFSLYLLFNILYFGFDNKESDGTDELNFHGQYHQYQKGHPLRRVDQMSTSLTKVAKPFNTGNNTSGGYKDSCMDRWKPIEVRIIEHKALPREALKPQ